MYGESDGQLSPFTYVGAVLPDCSIIQLDGNCDLWAPDVNCKLASYT